MRVLTAPGLNTNDQAFGAVVGRALAGTDGEPLALHDVGICSLSRPLSRAEVHAIRASLLGGDPYAAFSDGSGEPTALTEGGATRAGGTRGAEAVVAYLCPGRTWQAGQLDQVAAVADHADLTWYSPLRGPETERFGPRFPRVDGVYAPEQVMRELSHVPGVTIREAMVAGVRDPDHLADWEREIVAALDLGIVSSELVPVAVIAAHLGLRLAAAVIL